MSSEGPTKQHRAKKAPKPTRTEVLFQRHQERANRREAAKDMAKEQKTVNKMLSFKERMKLRQKETPHHSQATERDQEKTPEEERQSDNRHINFSPSSH